MSSEISGFFGYLTRRPFVFEINLVRGGGQQDRALKPPNSPSYKPHSKSTVLLVFHCTGKKRSVGVEPQTENGEEGDLNLDVVPQSDSSFDGDRSFDEYDSLPLAQRLKEWRKDRQDSSQGCSRDETDEADEMHEETSEDESDGFSAEVDESLQKPQTKLDEEESKVLRRRGALDHEFKENCAIKTEPRESDASSVGADDVEEKVNTRPNEPPRNNTRFWEEPIDESQEETKSHVKVWLDQQAKNSGQMDEKELLERELAEKRKLLKELHGEWKKLMEEQGLACDDETNSVDELEEEDRERINGNSYPSKKLATK